MQVMAAGMSAGTYELEMHATLPDGTSAFVMFAVTILNTAATPTCNYYAYTCKYTYGSVTIT
jgi:hypothetical protein